MIRGLCVALAAMGVAVATMFSPRKPIVIPINSGTVIAEEPYYLEMSGDDWMITSQLKGSRALSFAIKTYETDKYGIVSVYGSWARANRHMWKPYGEDLLCTWWKPCVLYWLKPPE